MIYKMQTRFRKPSSLYQLSMLWIQSVRSLNLIGNLTAQNDTKFESQPF